MHRLHKICVFLTLAALLFSLFCSCGESEKVYSDFPSSYSANGLRIACVPMVRSEDGVRITSIRVLLDGLADSELQTRLVSEIQSAADSLEKAPFTGGFGTARVVPAAASLRSVMMNVHVISNFGDRLSLILKKSAVYLAYGKETTVTAVDTLNYDLRTGEKLTLSSLFEDGFDACGALGEKLIERLAAGVEGVTQIAPIGRLPDDVSFTFDGEGITLYADEKTPALLTDPHLLPAVSLPYDNDLFSRLVIFDHDPTASLYDRGAPSARSLIVFPTRVAESFTGTVNGMSIRALLVLPEEYASAETEERVRRLAPNLEDIALQATGTGKEHYSCYFYAQRIGRFMTVRLAEEDYSGMNGYSSDRIYVFDAVTAENLSVASLFDRGFDYCAALAAILYPDASKSDLNREAEALALSQIVPRRDHFLVRYTAAARELSVLYTGTDGIVPYAAIGQENLTIYD